MVVGPAAIFVLSHDQAFVFVGSHRILAHSISEHLCILPHVRIRQVIVAVILEGKRTLSLAIGQVFQAVHAIHLKLALAPFHLLLRRVVGQFLHVGLQLGTTASTPENVGIAVGSLKHARIDAADALDGLRLRNERSLRAVGDGYTDAKAATVFGSRREIEIILTIALDAVGCPHGIGVWPHPRNFVLGDNHTVIGPVGEVLRREHVVVFHAEPVLSLSFRWEDVVRRIEIDLSIEHTRRWVGGEQVADNRILGCCRKRERAEQQDDSSNLFHHKT